MKGERKEEVNAQKRKERNINAVGRKAKAERKIKGRISDNMEKIIYSV